MRGSRRPITPLLWRFGDVGDAAALTFVLAPFAGGSAYSFADLPAGLLRSGDTALVLQYPGRGPRITEPFSSGLSDLAEQAAREIVRHGTSTLVLVGHSMGGVLCYEIASLLTAMGRAPAWVVVSAARPPDRCRLDVGRVLSMGREDWLAEIAHGAVTAGSTVGADDIADYAIPVMRSDYLMLARYRPLAGPLTVPVLALGGTDDPWVTDEHLAAWQAWTTGDFEHRTLAGGHFYYRDQLTEFCEAIRNGPRRRRPGHGSLDPTVGHGGP
ncbi:MAG TPA: alpha/beta fold hydrolase [Kineosporiaceae bacterium]